jgi:hypothetical protein
MEVVPSDNFCVPGLHPNSLEHTLSQNTNIVDYVKRHWTIRALGQEIDSLSQRWPSLSGHSSFEQGPSHFALQRNVWHSQAH